MNISLLPSSTLSLLAFFFFLVRSFLLHFLLLVASYQPCLLSTFTSSSTFSFSSSFYSNSISSFLLHFFFWHFVQSVSPGALVPQVSFSPLFFIFLTFLIHLVQRRLPSSLHSSNSSLPFWIISSQCHISTIPLHPLHSASPSSKIHTFSLPTTTSSTYFHLSFHHTLRCLLELKSSLAIAVYLCFSH